MSDYSELIKHFDSVREYMRDFYVYGFKGREDFKHKSARSYDNERRRIESYLGDTMAFRQEKDGKKVFLSVDSSEIEANPFYRAFKAKSFTRNDILLHFYILDQLQDGIALSAAELESAIADQYMSFFDKPVLLDQSTIRKKLQEYEKLGLLTSKMQGRKKVYMRVKDEIKLDAYADSIHFFSEISPLGVLGSTLLDTIEEECIPMSFKHHYIVHALESEIVYELLEAIHQHRQVEILCYTGQNTINDLIPLKILVSVQGGRRYLAAYNTKMHRMISMRLDNIKTISIKEECDGYDTYQSQLNKMLLHTWGVSFKDGRNTEHLEMTLEILPYEHYIIDRIEREGRMGKLTQISDTVYQYTIDIYDSLEILPWVRTFIGRIIELKCDNSLVVQTFYQDLELMLNLNGVDQDVV